MSGGPGVSGVPREPITGAALGLSSLPNMRDLGGYPTDHGGRVRTGLLYRSTDLSRISPDDAAALAALGIRVVYDLRTDEEQSWQPDRAIPGSRHVALDVLSSSTERSPAELMRLLEDASSADEILGGERGYALWERKYREFVVLDSARAGFGRLFAELADGAHLPALFHCTTGKDRTGWAAAALLLLLGVPESTVTDEYLLSARYLGPVLQPALDAFRAQGGDPELLAPIVAVRLEYLAAALGEMRTAYGSVERYFDEGLGIDPGTQRRLQELLVEPA